MRLQVVRSLSLGHPTAAVDSSVACAAVNPKRVLISLTTAATGRCAPSPPPASGVAEGGAGPPAPAARASGEASTFGEHTPGPSPCAGPHSAVSTPICASNRISSAISSPMHEQKSSTSDTHETMSSSLTSVLLQLIPPRSDANTKARGGGKDRPSASAAAAAPPGSRIVAGSSRTISAG